MGKKKSVLNKIKAASKASGKSSDPSSKQPPPLPDLKWPWRPTRPAGGAKARVPSGRMGSAMVPAVPGSGCDGYVVGGYNGMSNLLSSFIIGQPFDACRSRTEGCKYTVLDLLALSICSFFFLSTLAAVELKAANIQSLIC
jgi:hypothetical protein